MAASTGFNPLKSRGIKQLKVPFEFTTHQAAAVTGIYGKGVASVAYTENGKFRITLRDRYRRLAAFNAEPIGAPPYYKVNCDAVANENTSSAVTVDVVVMDSTHTGQQVEGMRIVGELTFEDSDA